MICSKCGTQNDVNTQFCKACGLPLNANNPNQASQNTNGQQQQQNTNVQNTQSILNSNQASVGETINNTSNVQQTNSQPNLMQPMNNQQFQNINNTPQQNNTMLNNSINNQPPIQNNYVHNTNMNPSPQKKNIIPFVIIGVVVILVIVGIIFAVKIFSSKTVTCTNTQSQYGQTINQTISAKFKNNKVDSVEILFEYKLSSDYVTYIDTVYKQVEQSFEQYKQKEGIDVNIKKESDKIVINLKATRKGLENLSEINLSSADDSLERFIKDMEDQNFTCKQ